MRTAARAGRAIHSLLVLVAAVACAPTPAATGSLATQREPPAPVASASSAGRSNAVLALIDGARREGQLRLVWGSGTIATSESIALMARGFNQLYGLDLSVDLTPGPSMPELSNKVLQEYQANRPASTDVLAGYASHLLPLINAGALQTPDWSLAANVTPEMVDGQGTSVVIATAMRIIVYNSNRVQGEDIPHSMADLLKPRYKGRVATYPFTYPTFIAVDSWGVDKTLDYVTKISDQAAGLIRCNETSRVASGEFDLFAPACNSAEARREKARGAPVDFVIPTDAALLQHMHVAVPTNAAHPNAARLFVNYLVSREAQDLQYQHVFVDSALVPGSRSAQDIAELRAQGVQFEAVNFAAEARTDPAVVQDVTEKVQRILQKQ